MNSEPGCGERRSIEEILAVARARLDRIEPVQLAQAFADGAMVVDIRPHEQRSREGGLAGAVVIDRNTLEWRLDPLFAARQGHDWPPAVVPYDRWETIYAEAATGMDVIDNLKWANDFIARAVTQGS